MFPVAPLCDGAICLSPKRSWARCFCGRQKSSREKCARNYLFWGNAITANFLLGTACDKKMELELGICSCGGPLHWHKTLCSSPEHCHPTGSCHFRNLLAGQGGGIWHHSCMAGKNIKANSPFSVQESQCVCLLCSTSRKSIAEGFLLGDLCFMKFMPGAEEDWGAGNDSAVFLPSAALIVCNDLISSTILPCSKHSLVAFYYLF